MSRKNRIRNSTGFLVALGMTLGPAATVHAHSLNKRFGDFYGGLLHPLTALEHLLPILALGLLAGQQGAKCARWVLLVFPAGLLGGVILGGHLEPNPTVEWINRLSLVALGGLVAAAVRLPLPVTVSLALLLGLTHGYENADVSAPVARHLFVPGVLVSGIAVVAVFAAIAASRETNWQQIAVRVVGSWIAAIGILVIAAA